MRIVTDHIGRVLMVFLLCTGVAMNSCVDGPLGEEEDMEQTGGGENAGNNNDGGITVARGPISLTVDDITATAAVFTARVDADAMADYQEVGFVYSKEGELDVDSESVVSVKVSKELFSETIKELSFGTRYYYTVYLLKNNIYQYGETKVFTTENVIPQVEVESSSISLYTTSISGSVTFLSDDDRSQLEVGVAYSASEEELNSDESIKLPATLSPDGEFSVELSELNHSTRYYYCSYVKQNDRISYGEAKTFTTEGLPDLKLEDIKTEVDVMSVTISGKIVGLENVDMSKVSLVLCWEYNRNDYQCKADQISENGEFRLVLDMHCKESQTNHLAHNSEYRRDLRLLYDSYMADEASISIHTYIPKGSVNISSVSHDSAEFTGVIDDFAQISQCPGKTSDGKIQVGIFYSTDPNIELSSTKKVQGTLNDDGTFTVALTGLIPQTRYYYRLVIAHNGASYGEIQEFTTLRSEASLPSGYTNLAPTSSANCYIVSQSGSYCFPVVRGNASSDWLTQTEEACVLWESFGTNVRPNVGDLIKSVSYSDYYITFKTADTFKEGNAVIAAKDADGTILWSWHIWLTDQPQGQEYYNNAGTMMDRNLGATSATPGDVGALGLLYQWGRKDPFLGSSSIYDAVEARSTINWPSPEVSYPSNGTIEYATANPTTFITSNQGNYDWCYTGSSLVDTTRWTTSDKAKSIYDPCPQGWRVPDGGQNGIWSKALGSWLSVMDVSLYDSTNVGVNFSGKFGSASTIWYPASGIRQSSIGLEGIANGEACAYYYSASFYNHRYPYSLSFRFTGSVGLSHSFGCSHGYSVRCVKEID